MKGLFIIVMAVALGVCGYSLYFRSATEPTAAMLKQPNGDFEWLRREFQLSDTQFENVRRRHQEYAPVCDAMCAKIMAANARLEELIQSHKALTPETEAALQECVRVQGECRRTMLGHVYAVGAEMPPNQGARYIAMMKARVIQPGLRSSAVVSASPK